MAGIVGGGGGESPPPPSPRVSCAPRPSLLAAAAARAPAGAPRCLHPRRRPGGQCRTALAMHEAAEPGRQGGWRRAGGCVRAQSARASCSRDAHASVGGDRSPLSTHPSASLCPHTRHALPLALWQPVPRRHVGRGVVIGRDRLVACPAPRRGVVVRGRAPAPAPAAAGLAPAATAHAAPVQSADGAGVGRSVGRVWRGQQPRVCAAAAAAAAVCLAAPSLPRPHLRPLALHALHALRLPPAPPLAAVGAALRPPRRRRRVRRLGPGSRLRRHHRLGRLHPARHPAGRWVCHWPGRRLRARRVPRVGGGRPLLHGARVPRHRPPPRPRLRRGGPPPPLSRPHWPTLPPLWTGTWS